MNMVLAMAVVLVMVMVMVVAMAGGLAMAGVMAMAGVTVLVLAVAGMMVSMARLTIGDYNGYKGVFAS
jgi:hypothetical protein